MALFGGTEVASKEQAQRDTLLGEIQALTKELQEARDTTEIGVKLEETKQELADKKIELSKIEEEHAKRIRGTEHKVGLQMEKAKQDQEAAVKEAELKVREANLEADKSRFEEQMKFERTHLENQISGMQTMFEQVLNRLPNHNVNQNIHEFRGGEPTEEQKKLVAGKE